VVSDGESVARGGVKMQQISMALRAGGLYVALTSFFAASYPAGAAVVDVGPNGFTVQIAAHISATPATVYAALIRPALWWSPDHSFSGNSANPSLDAKAGGRWCEKLPNGGSIVHLSVVYTDPGMASRKLTLTHLGKIFREEFMEPISLSAYALAKALGVSLPRVNDIVREKHSISPDMAVLLSAYFGTSDGYWINLQRHLDLAMAKDRVGKQAARISPHPHGADGNLQPV
jgi:addiction module HigA family antidote